MSSLRRKENLQILKANDLIVTGSATISDVYVDGGLVVSGGATISSGDTYLGGDLYVGGNDDINSIRFRGTLLDGVDANQTLYTNTIIAERRYDISGNNEKSELLLFKGDNTSGQGSGPDRVRVASTGGFKVDITQFNQSWNPDTQAHGPTVTFPNCIFVDSFGRIGIRRSDPAFTFDVSGNARITGALTANGVVKTFRIPHPVLSETELIHSCIEGPRADLIYRGRKQLAGGVAIVDLNRESTGNGAIMVAGTFEALCAHSQVFVTNNETWDRVRGSVNGAILTVIAESPTADCWIDWMVVAERNDASIKTSPLTDANGFLILEHPVSTAHLT
jgi:hypothetical protein